MLLTALHLLTAKAFRFAIGRTPLGPVPGTTYDDAAGIWRLAHDGSPLVASKLHDVTKVVSKKFDIETGEDQKGH